MTQINHLEGDPNKRGRAAPDKGRVRRDRGPSSEAMMPASRAGEHLKEPPTGAPAEAFTCAGFSSCVDCGMLSRAVCLSPSQPCTDGLPVSA